jgi:[ribosomal protein S18]-alanine N-acetyltransferase
MSSTMRATASVPAVRASRRLAPMTTGDLAEVLAIEQAAYALPWTRGNFVDSIAAGHLAQCLLDDAGVMLGYFIALLGAGEAHLLNLTVAPAEQRRGHARFMLDALIADCRQAGATKLWLEVRERNARARRLYRDSGFAEIGLRKAYYPALPGSTGREDAVVMGLALDRAPR